MESPRTVPMIPSVRQQRRRRRKAEAFGRRRGWGDLREEHRCLSITTCRTVSQRACSWHRRPRASAETSWSGGWGGGGGGFRRGTRMPAAGSHWCAAKPPNWQKRWHGDGPHGEGGGHSETSGTWPLRLPTRLSQSSQPWGSIPGLLALGCPLTTQGLSWGPTWDAPPRAVWEECLPTRREQLLLWASVFSSAKWKEHSGADGYLSLTSECPLQTRWKSTCLFTSVTRNAALFEPSALSLLLASPAVSPEASP